MAAKPQGVYEDGRGRWYLKVTLGRDPLTGKRVQITQRGFGRPLKRARPGAMRWPRSIPGGSGLLTVNEPLDLYPDGIDPDGRLSATCFYYRHYTATCGRCLGTARCATSRRRSSSGSASTEGRRRQARPGVGVEHRAPGPLTAGWRMKLAVTTGLIAVTPPSPGRFSAVDKSTQLE